MALVDETAKAGFGQSAVLAEQQYDALTCAIRKLPGIPTCIILLGRTRTTAGYRDPEVPRKLHQEVVKWSATCRRDIGRRWYDYIWWEDGVAQAQGCRASRSGMAEAQARHHRRLPGSGVEEPLDTVFLEGFQTSIRRPWPRSSTTPTLYRLPMAAPTCSSTGAMGTARVLAMGAPGGIMSLEHAVRRLTFDRLDVGIYDRVLRLARADINELRSRYHQSLPEDTVHDFGRGCAIRELAMYHYTIVNGQVLLENGHTPARSRARAQE